MYLQRDGATQPFLRHDRRAPAGGVQRGLLSASVGDQRRKRAPLPGVVRQDARATPAACTRPACRCWPAPTPGPASALHRELELYVLAGIPPLQVLRIATWNGAKYTQTLDRRGSIERGKLADLVLVEGDPSVNIADSASQPGDQGWRGLRAGAGLRGARHPALRAGGHDRQRAAQATLSAAVAHASRRQPRRPSPDDAAQESRTDRRKCAKWRMPSHQQPVPQYHPPRAGRRASAVQRGRTSHAEVEHALA